MLKLVKSITYLSALIATGVVNTASAGVLPAYKNEYFAYPAVISSKDNGAYQIIDYNEMRDINGRDAIPEKRVKDNYISLRARANQQDLVFKTEAGNVKAMAAGKLKNASFIVIYLHGRGGNRHQGMNDFTFGGNFNRVKYLTSQNGGLYVTPEFKDFADQGEAQIAALISTLKSQSPRAQLVLSCGSAGGALCWRIAANEQAASHLNGLVLLGSLWDDGYLKTASFKRRLPVFLAHGSRDPVFAVSDMEAFYQKLKKSASNYPAQFRRFESGNHGTPIRMADWYEILNWILK
ncbi:alpha/beta hydrolase [Paenochrobactrum pullorum]|uniref:alpha/beta hydrolase n=1 Tax=Paenochrobactrum pullorum TaxID=1324351 RepID=UPI0035BC9380